MQTRQRWSRRGILFGLAIGSVLVTQVRAGPIVNVDRAKALANGKWIDNVAFLEINTGTEDVPTTTFTMGTTTFNGRVVSQAQGPKIVVYDFVTMHIMAGRRVLIGGANPIAFLTLDDRDTEFDVLIEGALNASGGGQGPGAGGGSGGASSSNGEKATKASTGGGATSARVTGAGGGGGFGGAGGQGAIGGNMQGNRTGGVGGASYGAANLPTLFGGGGGGGGKPGGGGETGGLGGGGGGGLLVSTQGLMKIGANGRVMANGAAGGSPNSGMGGGGGAGGGIILSALDGVCKSGSIILEGNLDPERPQISARGGEAGSSSNLASGGGGGGGGRVFLTDPSVDLRRINVSAGKGGASRPAGRDGEAGTKHVCPEPSTLLAGMIGALALAGLWCRRRHDRQAERSP